MVKAGVSSTICHYAPCFYLLYNYLSHAELLLYRMMTTTMTMTTVTYSDASKSEVDRALSQGHRIGLAPGGISEMFEGYPKAGRHPDEECLILQSRKGFIKMALKHQVPVVPIYTFGSSKLLKRLQVPFLEKVSNWIRVSICFFYGVCGLPIPFQKKLLYVVGQPIHPPPLVLFGHEENGPEFEQQVEIMHKQFCDSLTRLFDKYKSLYGWDHKTLKIV